MKIILIVLVLAALSGCANDPVGIASSNNPRVPVALLFEHEGCRVYRFTDAGHYRYFTNCRGETAWAESCGKNCTRTVAVPTGR